LCSVLYTHEIQMPRKQTILYLSDNESDTEPDSEPEELPVTTPQVPAPPDSSVEKTPKNAQLVIKKNPKSASQTGIKNCRPRDMVGVNKKLLNCSYCSRPYSNERYLREHESGKCPVRIARNLEELAKIKAVGDRDIARANKREQNEAAKIAREARRPVEYVAKKKGGSKLKPRRVEVEVESDSEDEGPPPPPPPVRVRPPPVRPPAPPVQVRAPAPPAPARPPPIRPRQIVRF
jgi:hypothetical protein